MTTSDLAATSAGVTIKNRVRATINERRKTFIKLAHDIHQRRGSQVDLAGLGVVRHPGPQAHRAAVIPVDHDRRLTRTSERRSQPRCGEVPLVHTDDDLTVGRLQPVSEVPKLVPTIHPGDHHPARIGIDHSFLHRSLPAGQDSLVQKGLPVNEYPGLVTVVPVRGISRANLLFRPGYRTCSSRRQLSVLTCCIPVFLSSRAEGPTGLDGPSMTRCIHRRS